MGVVCAISALEQMLQERINSDMPSPVDGCLRPTQGLVFAGPVPILSHMALLSSLQTWSFTASSLQPKRGHHFSCPLQQQSLGHKLHPILNSSLMLGRCLCYLVIRFALNSFAWF